MNLLDSQNWNILLRASYQVIYTDRETYEYDYQALSDVQVLARSPILMIGIASSKALPKWKTGAWASMWLPFLPGSNTQFTATVQAAAHRCQLRQLNLIQFPYLGISPFILNISFPFWIEQADLEVWQYGESLTGEYEPPNTEQYKLQASLDRIEQRLGNPPPPAEDDISVEFVNDP